MVSQLELKGGELSVFALLYSFSMGEQGMFWGMQSYLARVTGISLSTVKRALASLVKKGYIEKCENDGVTGYRTTVDARTPPPEPPDAVNDATCRLPSPAYLGDHDLSIADFVKGPEHPKYTFYPIGKSGTVSVTAEQYKALLNLVSAEVLFGYARRLELLIENQGYRTHNPYKVIKKWILEESRVS